MILSVYDLDRLYYDLKLVATKSSHSDLDGIVDRPNIAELLVQRKIREVRALLPPNYDVPRLRGQSLYQHKLLDDDWFEALQLNVEYTQQGLLALQQGLLALLIKHYNGYKEKFPRLVNPFSVSEENDLIHYVVAHPTLTPEVIHHLTKLGLESFVDCASTTQESINSFYQCQYVFHQLELLIESCQEYSGPITAQQMLEKLCLKINDQCSNAHVHYLHAYAFESSEMAAISSDYWAWCQKTFIDQTHRFGHTDPNDWLSIKWPLVTLPSDSFTPKNDYEKQVEQVISRLIDYVQTQEQYKRYLDCWKSLKQYSATQNQDHIDELVCNVGLFFDVVPNKMTVLQLILPLASYYIHWACLAAYCVFRLIVQWYLVEHITLFFDPIQAIKLKPVKHDVLTRLSQEHSLEDDNLVRIIPR